MNYGALRNYVTDAIGRDDFPDYVYLLTTSGINRDCRFLDMEKTATVETDPNPATLPDDFGSIISAHVDYAGNSFALESVFDRAAHFNGTGLPRYYSIRDGEIFFAPDPNLAYTVNLQYIARLADLTNAAQTNDVMVRYPGLYLYQTLMHVATWAKDAEARQIYGENYAAELNLAREDDRRRRTGPVFVSRNARL